MEAHGPPPPPGWYPDPEGRGQRYWDGSRWTERLAGLQPAPDPPRATGLWWKIMLGVFLAISLSIAGCAVLIGIGVDEVKEELERHAITPEQFRSVEEGARRESVVERLGVTPLDPEALETEDVPREAGRRSCIYYSEKGTTLGFYELCFREGRLRGKREL